MTSTRLVASAYVLLLLGLAWLPSSSMADPLERYRPILRFDSSETLFPISIEAFTGGGALTPDRDRIDVSAKARSRPVVYGRSVPGPGGSRWLQYWILYADNPQDRGILRTGRHEGDWELVQISLGRQGKPQSATLKAHKWANTCDWGNVAQTRSGAPIVFVANGSHANYPRPGVKDRPWPDPNDEADGNGRTFRPAVERISEGTPRWVAWPGSWGTSEKGWVPGEHPSPRGPAFQPAWSDPVGLEQSARACAAGPPSRAWQTALTVGLAAFLLALGVASIRRYRARAL